MLGCTAHLFHFGCHLQREGEFMAPHHSPSTVPPSPDHHHHHHNQQQHHASLSATPRLGRAGRGQDSTACWNNGFCVCAYARVYVCTPCKRRSLLAANCLCVLQEEQRAQGEAMSALAVVFLAVNHNEILKKKGGEKTFCRLAVAPE